jgi:hypothetical protein
MTIRNKTAISLTLMGLFVMASPSNAATPQESGLENEVNQCVAEVRSRMNWEGASHVKHVVVAIERRTVGHKLKISTAVFGGTDADTIRAYAAECIVNGNNDPLQFDFDEIN